MLEANFSKNLPDFTLSAGFSVKNEEILVLAGPSGAGKTTILECLAGLQKPDCGTVTLDGEPLFSSARKINVPTYRRKIGYIFQDYALFAHMTVEENLLYGVRARGRGGQGKSSLPEIIERLNITHLDGRYPAQLSGGEKQRVSLARALLSEPALLLLDEPLSALDKDLRVNLRRELKELHEAWQIPFVLVTHCRCEAELGDDIVQPETVVAENAEGVNYFCRGGIRETDAAQTRPAEATPPVFFE